MEEKNKESVMKTCHFDGTIVITDPCYILPDNDREKNDQDWEICDNGHDMEKLIKTNNYICESTIYGDWSCTCWKGAEVPQEDCGEEKKYGKFCADDGQVFVAMLDDIISYNPNFLTELKTCRWCATIIENFHGDVEYIMGTHPHDKEAKYPERFYQYCYLRGIGNKPFITSQTGW